MMLPGFFQGYANVPPSTEAQGACVWVHTCPHRICCTQGWFASNWATTWKGQTHFCDSSAYWCHLPSPKSHLFIKEMNSFGQLSWIYLFKTPFGDLVVKHIGQIVFPYLCLHKGKIHMEGLIFLENTKDRVEIHVNSCEMLYLE